MMAPDSRVAVVNIWATLHSLIIFKWRSQLAGKTILIRNEEGCEAARVPGIATDSDHWHDDMVGSQKHRRKFRSQNSNNMDRWKAEMGRVREDKRREKKIRPKKKEDPGARKGRKVAKDCVFQWFVAPEDRKVGSLKRWVRSHLARWEMKSCTPLWREAHFEVKLLKGPHARTTFGSWDVAKVHTTVAWGTCRSQNVRKTTCSDRFWKLRCRKSPRICGAKHISKSKCTQHTMSGTLLVEMSKKCTRLWREAHVEIKLYKRPHARTAFGSWDVEKVQAVVARSTFRSQNVH